MLGQRQNPPPLWRGGPQDGVGAVVEGRSRFSNAVVQGGVNVAIHPSCMTISLVNKQHGPTQLHGIIGGGVERLGDDPQCCSHGRCRRHGRIYGHR